MSRGYNALFVTLTPSEHKQLAGLGLRVKVEPAQLGLAAAPVYLEVADLFPRLDAPVALDGVYERPLGPPTAADAALLSQKVVGVTSAASVREEEAARGSLVKIEPRHIARADALVLHLRALVCKHKTIRLWHGSLAQQVSGANKHGMLKHRSIISPRYSATEKKRRKF